MLIAPACALAAAPSTMYFLADLELLGASSVTPVVPARFLAVLVEPVRLCLRPSEGQQSARRHGLISTVGSRSVSENAYVQERTGNAKLRKQLKQTKLGVDQAERLCDFVDT